MKQSFLRYGGLLLLVCFAAILWGFLIAKPGSAHWADMAAAEIIVGEQDAQMTLTFPTGLASFADDDQNGQLSSEEVRQHTTDLQAFLGKAVYITDLRGHAGQLVVQPLDQATLPFTVQAAPNTHSSLRLVYAWNNPVDGLKIHYGLFLPGVTTASCVATILQNQSLQTFVFTPKQPSLTLTPGLPGWGHGKMGWGIVAAFLWGAIHSLSPGHGKTLVGAYLVGARATARHALFLAMTVTLTHTLGVFALGFITLFATQFILPTHLYPWLHLISGSIIILLGGHLFLQRRKSHMAHSHFQSERPTAQHHGHDHPIPAESDYELQPTLSSSPAIHYHSGRKHHHHHHHGPHDSYHGHIHRPHSHLPPGTDGSPVTWRSLLAVGVSGGLVPCPAALVLLLSAIALGHIGLGLSLVLAFSAGLASVLTGLGLLLLHATHLFQHLPLSGRSTKFLSLLSALCITIIGTAMVARSVLQIVG